MGAVEASYRSPALKLPANGRAHGASYAIARAEAAARYLKNSRPHDAPGAKPAAARMAVSAPQPPPRRLAFFGRVFDQLPARAVRG